MREYETAKAATSLIIIHNREVLATDKWQKYAKAHKDAAVLVLYAGL